MTQTTKLENLKRLKETGESALSAAETDILLWTQMLNFINTEIKKLENETAT